MGFMEADRNKHGMVFLRCGADHHAIGLKPMREGKTPSRDMKGSLQMEHLAFEVDNVDILKKAKAYLKQNGIPIVFEGRKGAGCRIAINFLDPDGYEFEIYCEMDQIGPDGRLRPALHRRSGAEDLVRARAGRPNESIRSAGAQRRRVYAASRRCTSLTRSFR